VKAAVDVGLAAENHPDHRFAEEDTCMSCEEEDTCEDHPCMSYDVIWGGGYMPGQYLYRDKDAFVDDESAGPGFEYLRRKQDRVVMIQPNWEHHLRRKIHCHMRRRIHALRDCDPAERRRSRRRRRRVHLGGELQRAAACFSNPPDKGVVLLL
jgi:hypothetical protein